MSKGKVLYDFQGLASMCTSVTAGRDYGEGMNYGGISADIGTLLLSQVLKNGHSKVRLIRGSGPQCRTCLAIRTMMDKCQYRMSRPGSRTGLFYTNSGADTHLQIR